MAQRSKARSFLPLVHKAKHGGTNSGILSNSGVGQKLDPLPNPSYGKKADTSIVRKAVDSHDIKVGMTHTKAAKSAAAIAKYAK